MEERGGRERRDCTYRECIQCEEPFRNERILDTFSEVSSVRDRCPAIGSGSIPDGNLRISLRSISAVDPSNLEKGEGTPDMNLTFSTGLFESSSASPRRGNINRGGQDLIGFKSHFAIVHDTESF